MRNQGKFGDYNAHDDVLVIELLKSVSTAQAQLLHGHLKALGFQGWWRWFENHLPEIEQFLQASPAQRSGQKHADVETHLLLVYGALQFAQLAGKMAHWFDNPGIHREQANSRAVRATQGRLLWQANFEPWAAWLFDELGELGSPFADEG